MSRTFNCGLGAVLVVSKQDAHRVLRLIQAQEEAWIVGLLAHKQLGALLFLCNDEKIILFKNIFCSYLCTF